METHHAHRFSVHLHIWYAFTIKNETSRAHRFPVEHRMCVRYGVTCCWFSFVWHHLRNRECSKMCFTQWLFFIRS